MRKNKGLWAGKTATEYYKDYRERKPEQTMLASARNRARIRDLPFDITVEDIVIPETCPILGIPLVRSLGSHGGSASSPSLDRIIPEKGYVKGNVQVMSLLANNMKSTANPEQLIKFAKWIMETYS